MLGGLEDERQVCELAIFSDLLCSITQRDRRTCLIGCRTFAVHRMQGTGMVAKPLCMTVWQRTWSARVPVRCGAGSLDASFRNVDLATRQGRQVHANGSYCGIEPHYEHEIRECPLWPA
jgi:hypothetical protein